MQVKDALSQKMQREDLNGIVGRIEVPVEQVKRIRSGKQTVHKRKLYPGYVFMEMEPTAEGRVPEAAWFIIKETSGVGDFIGTEGMPTPMRDTDVAKMLLEAEKPEEAPSIKVEFVEVERLARPSAGVPEGQLADAADLVHKQGRGTVVKEIYLVVGVVGLPQITYPCQFRNKLIHRYRVTQRLHHIM